MTEVSRPLQAVEVLVNIDVDKLDDAVRFYERGLGLRRGRRIGAAAVEMLGAAVPVYLLERKAGTAPYERAVDGRTYARHWTPVHLDVVVDDLEAAVRRAVDAGAALEWGIEEAAWGRLARLADPFGHGFCLLEFRGRGYDELVEPARG